jgi:hypothetical protein
MVLPATAEPEGYSAEKAKGNIKTIPAQGTWHFDLEIGTLTAEQAAEVETAIGQLLAAVPAAEAAPEEDMEPEPEAPDPDAEATSASELDTPEADPHHEEEE